MPWLVNRCGDRLQPLHFYHNLCRTQIYLFASVLPLMYDSGKRVLAHCRGTHDTEGRASW
jgi:hypothetical protein